MSRLEFRGRFRQSKRLLNQMLGRPMDLFPSKYSLILRFFCQGTLEISKGGFKLSRINRSSADRDRFGDLSAQMRQRVCQLVESLTQLAKPFLLSDEV